MTLMPPRTRWPAAALGAGAIGLLAGCEGERTQSMLHPAGRAADQVADLWWVMFAVYGGVLVVTLLLAAAALLSRRRERPVVGTRFVVVAGIAVPTLILIVMLIHTIRVTAGLHPATAEVTVEVTGKRWWWEVRYPSEGIVDANEIYVPAGVPVRLVLKSDNVIHSLWIPNISGKMDMLPEHPNELRLIVDRPGRYRGQCAEYCGTQHALMALWVVALEPDDYARWVETRKAPPPPPADEHLLRGRTVFTEAGCGSCHAIRGVADGEAGPDLTHMGSRLTLGAGTIANNKGGLGGWIANPQPIKPGVLMPPSYLPPDDLDALVDYLRSLE